jgi:hypothetical protein
MGLHHMHPNLKKTLRVVLTPVYLFAIGEVTIRLLSLVVLFFDIEMVEYAKTLLTKSTIETVSHQHATNTTAKIMGVDINLNALGHRSAALTVPKPADERRVHFLGSSITLGWGVPVEENFAEIAVAELNSTSQKAAGPAFVAINAGVPDYNTYFSVETFKAQAAQTKPDIVILQHHLNDARPNPKGGAHPVLRYSVFAVFLYQQVRSLGLLSGRSLSETYASLYAPGGVDWQRTEMALRELKSFCDERGIDLVAILIPELHDLSEKSAFLPLYKDVSSRFEAIGIPLINPYRELADKFSGQAGAMVAVGDAHPSTAAHQIIGRKIAAYLMTYPPTAQHN